MVPLFALSLHPTLHRRFLNLQSSKRKRALYLHLSFG